MEPARGGGMVWLWVGLAGLAFVLLLAILHMSGVARGPEEAIYSGTKNIPVVKWFTGWMHQDEEMAANLSPRELIDNKDIVNNLVRAERKIDDLESENKRLNDALVELSDVAKKVEKLEKRAKDELEYGAEPVEAGVGETPVAQLPVTAGAGAAAAPMLAAAGENYRLVSKIFEKIESDTAVDILNNLSDEEKVKILGSMKEGTVAEILSAFDPVKSAQLTRMLAASRK